MNLYSRKLAIIVLSAALFASCTKQDRSGGPYPQSDVHPAIPVTVQNATDYRPEPTVTTPIGSGVIQVVLSIPSGSGRTIKEITKIVGSTSYALLQSTTSANYIAAPIAGSGTTVTFNTSVTEYFAKYPMNATTNPGAKANTELTNRYYFLITLDDGTTIIPEPVRVLVL